MTYTNQILNATSNPQFYEQTDMDTAIMKLGTLTSHGNAWQVFNISKMGENYLADI